MKLGMKSVVVGLLGALATAPAWADPDSWASPGELATLLGVQYAQGRAESAQKADPKSIFWSMLSGSLSADEAMAAAADPRYSEELRFYAVTYLGRPEFRENAKVTELLKKLSGDLHVGQAAIGSLVDSGRTGKDLLEIYLTALKDRRDPASVVLRHAAARAIKLSDIEDERIVPGLKEALAIECDEAKQGLPPMAGLMVIQALLKRGVSLRQMQNGLKCRVPNEVVVNVFQKPD